MLLEERIKELFEIVETLRAEIDELREVKKEIYYQHFLEKYFQATHKVTKYGTTDISTESHHIEIKQWKYFKQALGQLKSYNHNDNKQLIVAFFGEYKDKNKIIELFHANEIEVWDLIKTQETINIKKHEKYKDDFRTWLERNIQYSQYSYDYIELNKVCLMYGLKPANKQLIPSRISNTYKIQIENYIKENFPYIEWKYDQKRTKDKDGKKTLRPRGWLYLKFKL